MLVLKHDQGGPPLHAGKIFQVYSGELNIGVIQFHDTGGHYSGTWRWVLNFGHRYREGSRGPGQGGYATREEAMQGMRDAWEAWLDWAGLQEKPQA